MAITHSKPDGARRTVKVLFLGQCLHYGYEGVDGPSTFPHQAASLLRSRFPAVRFRFGIKHLYHLSGLKAILKHRLMLTQPDIAVISLPAMFVATSWRVNLVYELAPEVVDTARSFMQKVEAKISGTRKSETLLDKAVSVRPPITLDEYERLIEESVEHCKRTSSCRVVLMGPGRFNEDSAESYANHSPEVWSSVNRMVLRAGQRLNVPVIDAQEALGCYGGEVFRPANHRFSVFGHEIVAREVASVLAGQVSDLQSPNPLANELSLRRSV